MLNRRLTWPNTVSSNAYRPSVRSPLTRLTRATYRLVNGCDVILKAHRRPSQVGPPRPEAGPSDHPRRYQRTTLGAAAPTTLLAGRQSHPWRNEMALNLRRLAGWSLIVGTIVAAAGYLAANTLIPDGDARFTHHGWQLLNSIAIGSYLLIVLGLPAILTVHGLPAAKL